MKRTEIGAAALGLLIAATRAAAQEHIPPEPPAHVMPDMSHREMVRMMEMNDRLAFHSVLIERLETLRTAGATTVAWNGAAYYGGDYHKIGVKSEGANTSRADDARIDLVWDRILTPWWSTQVGLRHDWGEGPSRDWLALGVNGLAPYFFDVDATAYAGASGRSALRVELGYEIRLTQRLLLRPNAQLDAYGSNDAATRRMAGLSQLELGLRLRYELRREVAPYFGVARERALGNTARLLRAEGEPPDDWHWVAGIRLNL